MLLNIRSRLLLTIVAIGIVLSISFLPVESQSWLVVLPNHEMQYIPSQLVRIVGQIKNNSDRPITDITVVANFRNETGWTTAYKEVILQSQMYLSPVIYMPSDFNMRFVLQPNMTIPFDVSVNTLDVKSKPVSYEMSVNGKEVMVKKQPALKVIEANVVKAAQLTGSVAGGGIDQAYQVVGQIKNEGSRTAYDVAVLFSLINQDKLVVGVGGYSDVPITKIEPNEIVNFALEPVLVPKEERVISVDFYAESREYTAFSTIPIETQSLSPVSEKISLSNLQMVDQLGSRMSGVSVGEQVVLQSSVRNNQGIEQKFAYIMQIKDSDGATVMIAWINGEIPSGKTFDVGLSWIPENKGSYKADVFVWQSVANPLPLSSKTLTATITVS